MIIILLYAFILFLCFRKTQQMVASPCYKSDVINILFAPPGCGKTTALAMLAHYYLKHKFTVYANFDLKGTIRIDWDDFGKYNFKNSVILIDEAGIDVNNRMYKTLTKDKIDYLKTHRHYRTHIWFASQAHDDIDITIRRLAQNYYIVSRTIFNKLSHRFVIRRINKNVAIDDNTHQVIDLFKYGVLGKYRFNGKKYWHMFDSFESKELPDFPVKASVPVDTSLLNSSSDDVQNVSLKNKIVSFNLSQKDGGNE